jgi:zinc protease
VIENSNGTVSAFMPQTNAPRSPKPSVKTGIFGVLLMTLASTALTAANAQPASKGVRAFHDKLENGMEVVVVPDRRAPVVTHMVWYRVGAADEPLGKGGIAHFLEHLMFKGTDTIPAGEFSKIVARLGGQDNAFTAQDITSYFQRVSKEKLPEVMRMEADRMANLRLDEKEVKTELKVIQEERRSRVDNDPGSLLQEQMMAALYTAHPYHSPIIGWAPEIKGLTREDALSFYKLFYAPNNAILVVTGDVEPDQIMALARETYGKHKPNPAITPRVRPVEPAGIAERRVLLRDGRAGKPAFERYYSTPSVTTNKNDAYALQVLARIIGASNTSRLYTRLVRDEKKAANASAYYSGLGLDYGTFSFSAVPVGDVKLEEVEALTDEVIQSVIDKGVTQEELDRAKAVQVANLIYASDSQQSLAHTYGWSLATGQTVADVESREDRIRAVTKEDVQRVAAKYLDKKNAVTGYLIPVASSLPKVDVSNAATRSTLH